MLTIRYSTARTRRLEKLLAKVTNVKTLETMGKISRNVHAHQKEVKYRKLKLTNAKIQELLAVSVGGGGLLQIQTALAALTCHACGRTVIWFDPLQLCSCRGLRPYKRTAAAVFATRAER